MIKKEGKDKEKGRERRERMYTGPNGVQQRYDNDPRIPLWVMGMSPGWKERTSRHGVFEGTDANTIMEQTAARQDSL